MTPEDMAAFEVIEAGLDRKYAEALARYKAEREAWQAERVAVVAELLHMPAAEVTSFLIGACHGLYGRPALHEDGPRFRPGARDDE